jgi:NRPS condensation-like uncharacterized protein
LLDKATGMNFVVFAEITGSLNVEHLLAAMELARQAHPLLRVRIEQDAEGELYFRPSGEPLRLEQIAVDQDSWRTPIEQELARPFAADETPLVRFRALQFTDRPRSVLALTFHHVIADGRSATSLLREILQYLVAPETGKHFQAGAIHPPMHEVFPPQYDWQRHPETARSMAAVAKAEMQRHGRAATLPWLDRKQARRSPRFTQIVLDAATTASLIRRCKANRATIHGAIGAAQLLAKHRSAGEAAPLALRLGSPADMRPYLSAEISTDSLGLFVTILNSTYLVGGEQSFWELARQVSSDLRRQLERGDGHLMFEQAKPELIPPSAAGIGEFANAISNTPHSSMISNIGLVERVDQALKVEAISFVLCPTPFQIVFSAVSTFNGRLIINVAYDEAKLSSENALQLAQWMRQALLDASGDNV